MLKMSTPFLHLVNQLHTSAQMESAEPVLAALAEGIWEDMCLQCNVTFRLETYQTNKAVHLLKPGPAIGAFHLQCNTFSFRVS